MPPPSKHEGFYYSLRIFSQMSLHKGTTIVYTRPEYTTLTLNSLQKEVVRNKWALQALGDYRDHKHSLLQLPIVYDEKWGSRSLWERKFGLNEWI